MITTVVQFRLPEPITPEQARETFSSTAQRYLGVAGLIRKQYLLSEDGRHAGGVYLWSTRADAEKLFTEDWKKFVTDKYGSEPVIAWFATPVLVDNVSGKIVTQSD